MTHPIELSLQAANLWLRAASLTVKAATIPLRVSAHVAEAVCERATAPAGEPHAVAEPARPARPPRASAPSAKQRRRAARGEPTPGQAAELRRARRVAEARDVQETDAIPAPGAEVQVAEPWEGYAALSAADVLARLAEADATTRAAARLYELAHERREAVLHATES
jgi:hypothetical protein